MADNVEGQGRGAADDQELREVVHGSHDSRCADGPEDVCWYCGEVWDGVEERDKGNEQTHGNGCLIEQQLRRRDLEILNLLADPDLVEGSGAEGESSNNDAEKLRLGSLIDGKRNTNAGGKDSCKHVACNHFAEQYKVDEDDSGGCHDLGELVEAYRVERQAEVPEDDVAGEEGADGHHVPDI